MAPSLWLYLTKQFLPFAADSADLLSWLCVLLPVNPANLLHCHPAVQRSPAWLHLSFCRCGCFPLRRCGGDVQCRAPGLEVDCVGYEDQLSCPDRWGRCSGVARTSEVTVANCPLSLGRSSKSATMPKRLRIRCAAGRNTGIAVSCCVAIVRAGCAGHALAAAIGNVCITTHLTGTAAMLSLQH